MHNCNTAFVQSISRHIVTGLKGKHACQSGCQQAHGIPHVHVSGRPTRTLVCTSLCHPQTPACVGLGSQTPSLFLHLWPVRHSKHCRHSTDKGWPQLKAAYQQSQLTACQHCIDEEWKQTKALERSTQPLSPPAAGWVI